MTIEYYTTKNYGQTVMYLKDEAAASLWQRISGKKTITQADMDNLTALTMINFERVFEPEV